MGEKNGLFQQKKLDQNSVLTFGKGKGKAKAHLVIISIFLCLFGLLFLKRKNMPA